MRKIFTVLGISVAFLLNAQTTVISETFTYTDATALSTSNSTTGWFQHSGTQGQITVSSGKASIIAGNSEDINKSLPTAYSMSVAGAICKVAYSAEINVLNSTGLTTTGDYFLSLGGTATTANGTGGIQSLPARLYIKAGTSGYVLGILNNAGGTVAPTYSTTEIPYGTAVNITINYIVTNDSTVNQEATLQIGSQSLLTNNTGTTAAPASVASITIRQSGNATSGTGNVTIDNLTVQTFSTSSLAVSDFGKEKSFFIKNTFVKNNEIIFGANAKEVKVFNMFGQVVKTASVKADGTLNVAELAKGNYIVTGIVNNATVSQKILKD
jgi:hypothetical protein